MLEIEGGDGEVNGGSVGVFGVPYVSFWCTAVRRGRCGEEKNEGRY